MLAPVQTQEKGDVITEIDKKIIRDIKNEGYHRAETREEIMSALPNVRIQFPFRFFVRNKKNPRKLFDPVKVIKLGESMKKRRDVDTPIFVTIRYDDQGRPYLLLVDGERRHRAGEHINLEYMSCIILPDLTDDDIFLISARANMGSEEFTPIEEAQVIERLRDHFGYSYKEVATFLIKSEIYVREVVQYLKLIPELQELLVLGKITKGVAKALVTLQPQYQLEGFRKLAIAQEQAKKTGKVLSMGAMHELIQESVESGNWEFIPKKKSRRKTTTAEKVMARINKNIGELEADLAKLLEKDFRYLVNASNVRPHDLADSLEDLVVAIREPVKRLRNASTVPK